MTEAFRAPIGTRDVLPPESARWAALVARFATHVEAAGYGLVHSPIFEDLGVFQRVGEGTDVVRKEMYELTDKGGRHLALRPEGTASVVRAYNQHRPTPPWKAWYAAPSFRYERPQAGRYRQHHQVGVEALGSADPDVDVEVIVLLADFYTGLGLRDVQLKVNSMGDPATRVRYVDALRAWLVERLDAIDPADHDTVHQHPMRVLDSKREATRAVTAEAPEVGEYLSDDAVAHFERVRAGLDAAGVPYVREPRLVRGLDYYTHTTFEFASGALDTAQNGIGGGGRYDGLAEALGGQPTPGVGFGSGIERILLACDAEETFAVAERELDCFVVDTTDGTSARDLTLRLRRDGLAADRAWDGRSMKAQMKAANRSGARLAVIVGEDEAADGAATVRDLRGDRPQERVAVSDLADHVRKLLSDGR
ncbi:MAG: histidine--tRNA ligase [Actinomycetota bacterium]|nr:histidine--tRNA ligase [Actinomycetota bacterium]